MLRLRALAAAAVGGSRGGRAAAAGDEVSDVAREVEILARVAHPNIIKLHEVIGDDSLLVMC